MKQLSIIFTAVIFALLVNSALDRAVPPGLACAASAAPAAGCALETPAEAEMASISLGEAPLAAQVFFGLVIGISGLLAVLPLFAPDDPSLPLYRP